MSDHIIVVDDDVEDHMILRDYFRDAGTVQHVRFFENGWNALQYLENIPDDLSLPKLIVLDLNMPIMNGTQMLVNLKRTTRLKNIPVIIFSTSENETEKRKSLSLGAVDYLVKPVTYEEGQRMVNRFISYLT